MAKTVRILPSSEYQHAPPSPPSSPPPKPTKLCKIAVLGDATKTSLVQTFIHREPRDSPASLGSSNAAKAAVGADASSPLNDCLSTTSSLHSASLGVSVPSTASVSGEYASYHKKDVTLCHHGEDICIRTQVWDVNLPPSLLGNNNNNTTHRREDHKKIISLLSKCHSFVLALRAPSRSNTASYSTNSSIGSTSLYSTIGDWAELDSIESQIIQWVQFLRVELNACNIALVFTHGEECVVSYSPRNWMEMTRRMEGICTANNIPWRMCCTCYSDGMGDMCADWREGYVQHEFIQRMEMEQKKMKEDMMDAVELTFIESILMFLNKR